MQARDIPRVIHNPPPGPIDLTDLADGIERLDVNTGRYTPARANRAVKDPVVVKDDPRSVMHYDGYTFFKSEAQPGQVSTWKNAEKTRMNLNQADLYKMVDKRSKRNNAAEHYSNLSRMKRIHIDDLIKELEHHDPRYEWTLVYIKEEDKPVKGKGYRRGDYETLHMDVVLMRKPVAQSYPKNVQSGQVNFDPLPKVSHFDQPPVINQDPRQMNKPFVDNNAPWVGLQGQVPPPHMANHLPQQVHPQFHQPQQQPPPPPHGHQMGGRPQVNQEPWVGMPPGVQQMHHQQQQHPDMMHAAARAAAGAGAPRNVAPPFEVLHQNHPGGFDGHPQGQRQFAQPRQFPPKGAAQQQHQQQPRAPKPPVIDPEVEYISSSGGDDESMLFEEEYSSSITDSDDDEMPTPDRRGSLFRRHSSKSRRPEPAAAYRKHYRKQPRLGPADPKYKTRYSTGYVDVVPGDSKHGGRRLGGKRYHQQQDAVVARQLPRDRPNPKILQGPSGPVITTDELDLVGFDEKYRGYQARSDLRTRLLDEREARVERREQLVDSRARRIDEQLGEAAYLGRSMSLREPTSYHRRRYLPDY
ncbi:hypothetical protein FE257_003264 [Aspergillus nanangensis]|uniref:Uncharacterized protein n=1 Tax=Aspergillus nanangensis TaxID=2582783 RepID=A0AAD4CU19_ASPNN|nr:hypothetical protein FE257_003264 [Aspergillus nanangensis]